MAAIRSLLLGVAGFSGACFLLLIGAHSAGVDLHVPSSGGAPLAAGLLFLLGWTLMTGAMTFPASLPFLSAILRVGGPGTARSAAGGLFVAWLGAGVVFTALLWLAGDLLASLPPGGPERIAAAMLLVAALYTLTPVASACQQVCMRPVALIARHWRGDGRRLASGWRAGLTYGIHCVGCCVPMMLVMFIVGMGDVRWIFALGLVMALQKHPRLGLVASPVCALAMLCAAGALWLGAWQPELMALRELCGA